MNLSELSWGIVGLVLTVMVLSYAIGDNFLFRLASHIFIGLTAGYILVIIIHRLIWPYMVTPLAAGTWGERAWMLIPIALVLLLIISQIPKYSNLGIIPVSFLIGVTAAIVIGGAVFGTLIPQISAIVDRFDPAAWSAAPEQTWFLVVDAVVMLVGVIGVLSFFYFGRQKIKFPDDDKTKRPRFFEGMGKIGQVFIGITLGAIFAGIFSSTLWALIDRLSFGSELIKGLFGGA
jgi:hypothetical protein